MLRLRSYGQPITLFGETDTMRLERLKLFEIHQHERQTGASEGRTNIFMEIMNQEVDSELAHINATTEEEEKVKDKIKQRENRRANKYAKEKKKTDFKFVEDYILFYFKKLLREWEIELANRPKDVCNSTKGKVASATHKQRSEERFSRNAETDLVCRLLLEKKKEQNKN
eukprot:TRINITY_DN6676_c0_g1_i11.p1 TRINITY_DN6676_c0_g1~~TRINITY_DN6676_c0_g1_i11.p1  ORF type:complete len:170 (-),score=36.24 TRINITY_DN6676_c0_g1_i11:12-521(-)